jgi:carbamoyltransferase
MTWRGGAEPTILGIGGSDHDVHACLVRDGEVVVTIEEERLSRRKYGIGGNLLEGRARRYCLEAARLSMEDIDAVVVDQILPLTAFLDCRSRARRIDHHLAHASAAWFTSGYPSAAVLVVDNAGGLYKDDGRELLQATTWYRAEGRSLELVGRVGSSNWVEGPRVRGEAYQRGDGDDSLGHFYKKATGALGYRYPHGVADGEFYFPEDGITMGLAAFGEPRHMAALRRLVTLDADGRYRIRLTDGEYDGFLRNTLLDADFQARADVAASVQEMLVDLLSHIITGVIEQTGEARLCLAGGVAMNSSANGQLLERTPIEELYVPPMPADNGTAVGACLWRASRDPNARIPTYSVYAGRSYEAADVAAAVATLDRARWHVVRPASTDALLDIVARALAAGHVIGWYEGGGEHGRRALGHRSLLADPREAKMRDRINHVIKRRQHFRPFAPVVLEDRAAEFFERCRVSPYMQVVYRCRPERREEIAAVVHVDGTARVQTLRADQHPLLYRLIERFERISGVPMLLNTSFNGRGEPIVETPEHAVRGLESLGLDGLVLDGWWITPTC